MKLGEVHKIKVICRGGSRISREGGGGANKGEGLHYEAMQYHLNAGWKDKYQGKFVCSRVVFPTLILHDFPQDM